MTRINCIPVQELTDKHLGAEYRELPRLFKQVAAAVARGERPDDPRNPTRYTLGEGHVRFFYPRLGFIVTRYHQIALECVLRNRKVLYDGVPPAADEIPPEWFGQWKPDAQALALNRARIAERLSTAHQVR